MKLVEIKDVRPGQVWQFGENMCRCFVVERTMKTKTCGTTYQAFDCPTMPEECKGELYIKDYDMPKIPHGKLIGKTGITHRTEDGKLVEIPRTAEFQIDDVVKFKWCDPRLYVINREIDFGIKESHPNNACFEATNDLYGSCQLVDFELKRVGILGVTHEFVNDREA